MLIPSRYFFKVIEFILSRGRQALLATVLALLTACGGGSGSGSGSPDPGGGSGSGGDNGGGGEGGAGSSAEIIKLNQLGFLPAGSKLAVVPATGATEFQVIKISDDSIAYSGQLSSAATWAPADLSVQLADFSSLQQTGDYRLRVSGVDDSDPFRIAADVYSAVHDASLKAYYFNRASTALNGSEAGDYARAAGHPDDQVKLLAHAASAARPEGTIVSAPKGWYDAGDYNKYVVNSGISTYSLLIAWEHFPEFYQGRDLNIPESGDAMPDVLDEALWNLEWMMDMQDPNDGGVYHKLTTLNFSGAVMPAEATAQRYMTTKSTAATLDFAAVMAVASRIFANFESQRPGLSAQMQQAAIAAWDWAEAHPDVLYSGNQPDGVSTGAYGDGDVRDERSWAAAELFLLTGASDYLNAFLEDQGSPSTPGWPQVRALAYISLLDQGQDKLSSQQYEAIVSGLDGLAQGYLADFQASAWAVPMVGSDFIWGSNSVILNKAMVLVQAYRHSGNAAYLPAIQAAVDYVLGRNGTDYSFITGFGARPPMHIHHRPSQSDGIDAPIPGFVAGGAQNGKQDGCSYSSDLPARTYLDDFCSYSTNEIAINWNAPAVYVLAAIQALP